MWSAISDQIPSLYTASAATQGYAHWGMGHRNTPWKQRCSSLHPLELTLQELTACNHWIFSCGKQSVTHHSLRYNWQCTNTTLLLCQTKSTKNKRISGCHPTLVSATPGEHLNLHKKTHDLAPWRQRWNWKACRSKVRNWKDYWCAGSSTKQHLLEGPSVSHKESRSFWKQTKGKQNQTHSFGTEPLSLHITYQ